MDIHTHCTHSWDGLNFFLYEVTTMFLCPMRNAFYNVTWRWWCSRRWKGGGSSDSCFPSARQSTAVIQSQEQQSGAQRSAGAKIPPIRRSSQFALPHPRCSSASQACLSSVMCKSVAKSERVAAIWESLCLFLIVSCLFTPTQLC